MARKGDVLTKWVAVHVADADNCTADDRHGVQIEVVWVDPEIPAICRLKPWLPKCRELRRLALERIAKEEKGMPIP